MNSRKNEETNTIFKSIIEIFKQPLIYVLTICLIVQFKVYGTVQEFFICPDSSSYLEYSNIFEGKLDKTRTPVYPYFIKLIDSVNGDKDLLLSVIFVQKWLFVITLLLFYSCVQNLTKNKAIIAISTLIFGTSPYIILWNIFILTESISLLEITILSLLTILYLKKPKYSLALAIGIIILLMVLTRPAFIYLLPVYILFWVLKLFEKGERKYALMGFISSLICLIAILGYCNLMKQQYGKFALTDVSTTNSVVSAISSNTYRNSNNMEMIKIVDNMIIKENKDLENITDVSEIYKTLARKYDDTQLKEFASSSLKTPEYLEYLLRRTIKLGKSNIGINYVDNSSLNLNKNSKTISYEELGYISLPITFGFVYFLVFGGIVYLIYNLIKNKKVNWIVAFFTSLIFASTFTIIVGAAFETQRLFLSTIILVLLFITYIISKALK